jgi:hydrogenase maturation protease
MSSPENRAPILVLGIGNILLRDEGVGVRAIEAMRTLNLPPEVELVDGGTGGADLLDIVCDRRKVIVVDAMDAGATPGTILRLAVKDLADADRPGISLHEIGLLETLAMARHLASAPAEVCVFGIQPGEIGPGDTLTEVMLAAIPTVIEMVLAELRE